jgi:hypothetical protein
MRLHVPLRAWRKSQKIARKSHCHQILLLSNNSNRLEYVVSAINELAELKKQIIIATLSNLNGVLATRLQVSTLPILGYQTMKTAKSISTSSDA